MNSYFNFTEAGDNLNGTVKEAMVGAVHGIGQGLDGVLHTATDGVKTISKSLDGMIGNSGTTESGVEYTHIPLKDVDDAAGDAHLAEFKQTLLKKVQSFETTDAADGVDDLMKETADMAADVPDALDAVLMAAESMTDDGGGDGGDAVMSTLETGNNVHEDDVTNVVEESNADAANHQRDDDSLRTSSPDEEIEKALANNDSHRPMVPSPVPTINELHELEKAAAAAAASSAIDQP